MGQVGFACWSAMKPPDSRLEPTPFAADAEVPETLRQLLVDGVVPAEIRLDSTGRWLYQGQPVEHPRVMALFHRSLERTQAGHWLLRVGRYAYPVVVEDTGRFVVRLAHVQGRWQMELIDGSWQDFEPAAIWTDGETFFGCLVRTDQLARFVGSAMFALAELLEARGDRVGVAVDGQWWPLKVRS